MKCLLLRCKYKRNAVSFKGSKAQSFAVVFIDKGCLFSPDCSGKPADLKANFPARKERPTEAPFVVCKNSFRVEDLKRKAGWAP